MINGIFIFWLVVNSLLLIYILQEFVLTISALFSQKKSSKKTIEDFPIVTIQLPLYNEPFVVRRLLEACARLDYPKEKLEIQILDDSNDQTSEIIKDFLDNHIKDRAHFVHIQRVDRTGFKAGALAEGLKRAQGDFVAIFDADFVPYADFLLTTLPHFKNEKVGVVQTRWGHLNEEDSLLTRAQAIMLNTHFSIEQLGRSAKSAFINFNGTAGVWRKACIDDAGGWEADTLTEDLDLSYRAQIKKWKFKYLFDIETPAELPISFEAYKVQQFRWSKGAAQCVRKNMRQLWSSTSTSASKFYGTFHLLNSSIYFLVCLLLLTSPLVYYATASNQISVPFYQELSLLGSLVSLFLLLIFSTGHFLVGKLTVNKVLWFIPSIITFFTITSGISFYMALGVMEGYLGKNSAFIRTPKFGKTSAKNSDSKKSPKIRVTLLRIFEFAAMTYGLFLMFKGIQHVNPLVIIYGFILFIGFLISLFFPKVRWRWGN